MWLEIYKNQSPHLFKKRLKIDRFRFFEKFCHLNLLDNGGEGSLGGGGREGERVHTFPHEFIFVFILYFIRVILSKKCFQMLEFQKKGLKRGPVCL